MKSSIRERIGFVNSTLRWGALLTVVALTTGGCVDFMRLGGRQKPKINNATNQTVECDGAGNQAELDAWLNGVTATSDCDGVMITNDFQGLVAACGATGAVTVTWTATDECNNSASKSATFTIVDTTNPALSEQQPISVDCSDAGAATALQDWLASATASDTCGMATITTARSSSPGNCTATITWTATDDCGNATSNSSTYTTNGDTTAPTATLNGDAHVTIECGTEWQDPGVTAMDDCDVLIQAEANGSVDTHTPGDYVVMYETIDACGNSAPALNRMVTVEDTTPPVVTLKQTPEFWPPNHRLESLTLADLVIVDDACEGMLNPNDAGAIIDIYSDEPDNSTGDGNTTGDIVITDDHSFSIRVERKGNGNGRVYGVRFEVTDSSGNATEATAYVHVPHDQSGAMAVDDGASNGQTVTR